MSTANSIREYRERLIITQKMLAEKCGLTQNHICQIELGKRKPSLNALSKIANALEVSVSELIKVFEESID